MTEPQMSPLTAELLTGLLGEAQNLATQAHRLLAPVTHMRTVLRTRLLNDGHIIALPTSPAETLSLAAVDGGCVRQHLYAADMMVAVAASAEGMTSTGNHPLHKNHWAHVIAHESENDRLLSAAMASLEIVLLNSLTHSVRILDGSHGTPVIALSTALAARSTVVAESAARLITEEVVTAMSALADPENRANLGDIVALPKADASHAFSDMYHVAYNENLPGGDRFIAAQVLNPGEMLYPRAARELSGVHFTVRDDASHLVRLAAAGLDHAINPLREAVSDHRITVTYIKPTTADTVLKMECRTTTGLPGQPDHTHRALTETLRMARILSDETPGPYMQEPFAQYAVDLAAKSVAIGAEALNEAMLANLPDDAADYLTLLARNYRT